MAEKLNWTRHDIDPGSLEVRAIGAGPQAKAHFWSRSHGTSAAVLAADRGSMFGGDGDNLQKRALLQRHGHDALAVVDDEGVVRIGITDADGSKHLFGADFQPDSESKERWATLAVSLGSTPVNVSVGLWLPEEESWHGTNQLVVLHESMPHDSVQANYQHTPIVEPPR